MTPQTQHINDWLNCTRCPLHETRLQTCLYRTTTIKLSNTDILFIGEAPGEAEDVIGKPFIGSAGDLLQKIIDKAEELSSLKIQYTITNLIACKPPSNDVFGSSIRAPIAEEVNTCRPRVIEIIDLCDNPKIITIGSTAKKYIKYSVLAGSIVHPSYMLRQPQRQKQTEFYRAVTTIREVMESLVPF